MNPFKIPTLIVPLLALTACGDLMNSVEPPSLEPPPVSFTQPCERPILLPNREVTQSEVETLWAGDRVRLITCANRYSALVDFYKERDREISGE